ncbi:MAG: hypothetical protein RIR12_185 [Bacteroidota bacterium]|jgi:hypothetical protein
MKKIITSLFIILVVNTLNTYAQEDDFFVPTASKYNRWEYVKNETDKDGKGVALLAVLKKEFGLATSINLESNGDFMWNVTTTDGSSTSVGTISEKGDFCYFTFFDKKVIKASPSFREYDTIMVLTLYGKTKEEFVSLFFKAINN